MIFRRLNQWYDRLAEPWRMLFALFVIGSFNPIIVFGTTHHHPIIIAIGVLWLFFILAWVFTRAF